MKAPVTVVDYGLGNIKAFVRAYERLGVLAAVATEPSEIKVARKIILPGVGSFDWAMKKLNKSKMRDALDNAVLNEGVPVLGVCVGMQMMAKKSDEGSEQGLGWLDAEIVSLSESSRSNLPLPHMGWNDITISAEQPLFSGMNSRRFYFLHSYFLRAENHNIVAATCSYGKDFAAAVAFKNILGTQFHPEKSHRLGQKILKNFLELI